MLNVRLRKILLIALGAGCALAALAIGWETGWGQHLRPVAPQTRLAPANLGDVTLNASFSLGALDQQFQESGNRPLFAPSRRLAPAAQQATAIVRGQFQLVGTSITKEFGDSAMLREVATNKTTVVKKGTAIKDMTVDTVQGDRVVLKKGDETEELFMKAQGSPKQPPVAVGQEGPLGASPVAGRGTPPAAGPGAVSLPQPLPPTAGPIPPAGPIPTAPGMPRPTGQTQVMPGATLPNAETQRPSITAEEILERRRRARAQQTQ